MLEACLVLTLPRWLRRSYAYTEIRRLRNLRSSTTTIRGMEARSESSRAHIAAVDSARWRSRIMVKYKLPDCIHLLVPNQLGIRLLG